MYPIALRRKPWHDFTLVGKHWVKNKKRLLIISQLSLTSPFITTKVVKTVKLVKFPCDVLIFFFNHYHHLFGACWNQALCQMVYIYALSFSTLTYVLSSLSESRVFADPQNLAARVWTQVYVNLMLCSFYHKASVCPSLLFSTHTPELHHFLYQTQAVTHSFPLHSSNCLLRKASTLRCLQLSDSPFPCPLLQGPWHLRTHLSWWKEKLCASSKDLRGH